MVANRCQTLVDRLVFRANNQPDSPLYIFLDGRGRVQETLTYAGLLTAVQQLGSWLSDRTEVGDRVAIQLTTSAEFVITFFACLYTARIPVPLSSPNRKYEGDHYQKIFADCGTSQLVTTENIKTLYNQSAVSSRTKVAVFPPLKEQVPLTHHISRNPYDVAFLQYTSGSTSFPKGVKVSSANIMANQRMIERTFAHDRHSIGLAWVPLFHDMGLIGSVIQPLYVGFPCYFISPMAFVKRPKLWLDLISEKKVTTTGGPNFAYDLCLKRVDPATLAHNALASWQVAYNGAEHVKLSTLEQFNETFGPCGFSKSTFLPCYGLAEATLIVSGVNQANSPATLMIPCRGEEVLDADAANAAGHVRSVVSSGQVMPELTLKIVNPKTLRDCATYHIGEIWISGESISKGYWNKPEKTAETFVFREGKRFLRTGDLGFLTAEKSLYLTGRLKDLIVIEGTNYVPQDIEETAQNAHLALNNARVAVFAITHSSALPKLVVVCELSRPYSLDIEQYANTLEAAVKKAVYSRYQLSVHETVFLANNGIPKTTSGKLQRQRTKLMYLINQLPVLSRQSPSINSSSVAIL